MIQVNAINLSISHENNWSLSEEYKANFIAQLKQYVLTDMPNIKLPYSGHCMVDTIFYIDDTIRDDFRNLHWENAFIHLATCIVQAGIVDDINNIFISSNGQNVTDNHLSVTFSICHIYLTPIPPMPKTQPKGWTPPEVEEPPF